MKKDIAKLSAAGTIPFYNYVMNYINSIIEHILDDNNKIYEKQKEVWLSSLNLKKEELNILASLYKDRELKSEEREQFKNEVMEIFDESIDINNQYAQKLEKWHEQNLKSLIMFATILLIPPSIKICSAIFNKSNTMSKNPSLL